MSAFRGFVRKEALHIARDRRTLVVLIMLPIVAVLLFGFAVRTDVNDVPLAIVDPAPDHATLRVRDRLAGTGVFRIAAVVPGTADLEVLFQRGTVRQAIVFEAGFAQRLEGTVPARVLIITDATDPNTGSAMQAYALAVLADHERERDIARGTVRISTEVRMRFNPTMQSANLFVPGLIAFVLTIVCALMTAISITREKETGTMEVLLVSPLRPWQIIIGKVLPYLLLGFVNAVTVLLLARTVFAVPVAGSTLLLLAYCVLYVLTALAIGVFISTRTDSQRVAMTAALAGMLMPTLMLSGFIFPIESMPAVLQWVSNFIPAKWFLIIVRGIMLKGVGVATLWQETLILTAMTTALLAASMRRFNVRLA